MILHKILCPTDFSEVSFQALQQAVDLASMERAEVCVIHVEPVQSTVTRMAGISPYTGSQATRTAEAIKKLCGVLEKRVPVSVRSHSLLKRGDIGEQIVCTARDEETDLIVLSTHGAGGLQSNSLGTIAKYVVCHAPCPVITINNAASPESNLDSYGTSIGHSNATLPATLQTIS